MTYSVKIKSNLNDHTWAWEETYANSAEVRKVRALSNHSPWSVYSMFIPVRTNNLKDVFIPTIAAVAMKANSLSDKILLGCICFLADISSLAFRIITYIPRAIYINIYSKEKDPFYQYLKAQGAPANILNQDSVYVKFEWDNDINGKRYDLQLEDYFHFIDLPFYDAPHNFIGTISPSIWNVNPHFSVEKDLLS